MKGILARVAPLGALLLVMGVGSARASVLEAKVPFDFVVRGQTLPAGNYLFERDENQPSVLFLRSKENRTNLVVFTEPAGHPDPEGQKAVLRFTRDGSQYRLVDVWSSHDEGIEIEGGHLKK